MTLPLTSPLLVNPIPGMDLDAVPHVWRLGSTRRHCRDCYSMDGEVRTLEEWQGTVLPGDPALACGGTECRCRLVPVAQAPTRYLLEVISARTMLQLLLWLSNRLAHRGLEPQREEAGAVTPARMPARVAPARFVRLDPARYYRRR